MPPRSNHSSLTERKRRGSDARRRYVDGYIVTAEAPDICRVGRSRRAEAMGRRPGIGNFARDRVTELAADGMSLREIGREVGISHEGVRTILREHACTVD